MTALELLASLEATLLRIRTLVPPDQQTWNDDGILRLAVERLWITAGTVAEVYRLDADIPTGVGPWPELYAFRCVLAHALPDQVSADRVWMNSVNDTPWLLAEVRSAAAR